MIGTRIGVTTTVNFAHESETLVARVSGDSSTAFKQRRVLDKPIENPAALEYIDVSV